MNEVTRILNAIEAGDPDAAHSLLPVVYDELRTIAAQKLVREGPGHTLQATALVHEAYLRLGGTENQNWQNRSHFFGAAAEAMRRILIDHARQKHRQKRGGGKERMDIMDIDLAVDGISDDLLALDEALTEFTQIEPIKAELVKLRFFAGLSIEQAATILNISTATAKRYWTYTKTWLYRRIHSGN